MNIVTLDDGSRYVLGINVNYNNSKYFLALEFDKEDNPTDNYKIFKEIILNQETYLEEENDKTICNKIAKKYLQKINLIKDKIKESTKKLNN